jgi:hypothetical protein
LAYHSYFNSIQNSIVQKYLGMIKIGSLKHAPIISNLLTEELLKSELTPYLPEGLYISKGEVAKGWSSSGDCDLIIFRKPVIFQYGSVIIVSRENTKAIIDIEIHGEKFLKAFHQDMLSHAKRISEKKKKIEKLKEFADKVFCVGIHAHATTEDFKWWRENKDNYLGQTPIFILYTRHNKQIVEGEFERLIKAMANT